MSANSVGLNESPRVHSKSMGILTLLLWRISCWVYHRTLTLGYQSPSVPRNPVAVCSSVFSLYLQPVKLINGNWDFVKENLKIRLLGEYLPFI